jgi:hypothetical protein
MKQTLHGNYFTPDPIEMSGPGKLYTILISSNDEKIVILAESDKGYLEIWGGFLNSLEVPKKLPVKEEKIRYEPKTDSAHLLENERMKLQITTLRNRETLSFVLDRLFEHEPIKSIMDN